MLSYQIKFAIPVDIRQNYEPGAFADHHGQSRRRAKLRGLCVNEQHNTQHGKHRPGKKLFSRHCLSSVQVDWNTDGLSMHKLDGGDGHFLPLARLCTKWCLEISDSLGMRR